MEVAYTLQHRIIPSHLSNPTPMPSFVLTKAPDPVGTRVTGKVTRAVLDKVFGPALLATLNPHGTRDTTNIKGDSPPGPRERETGGGADCENVPDVLSERDGVDGNLQASEIQCAKDGGSMVQ